MKLEDQVVSLELAKKLKELGVKQESLFWWNEFDLKDWEKEQGVEPWSLDYQTHNIPAYQSFSAYTVAELGEMLPVRITTGRRKSYIMGKQYYFCNLDGRLKHQESANTEADARAQMLVYIIENNLFRPQV
jgi:hypothetical protein